ncbi:MAG: caspase family protein [Polyangia bacterium]
MGWPRLARGLALCGLLGTALGLAPAAGGVRRVEAAERRALLIGINRYQVNPATDRTQDLDGAVFDAEALSQLLQRLYGFRAQDIRVLRDQAATRDAILRALDEHLVAPAAPGDLSVFYFAGHGSYVPNRGSRELDRRDETLVPADTNRGAPDLRDKELSARFNKVLDKGAQLVALFDSCHSGSIARGLPGVTKTRYAPPARGDTAAPPQTPSQAAPPEERGALIFSAAQDQQPAQERRVLIDGRSQPRGLFTSALEQVLSGPFRDEPASALLLRVRAIMQSSGSQQEPVLAATAARLHKTLFGGTAARTEPGVAVARIDGSTVHLQGGLALGLGAQAELRRERGSGRPALRLRVREVTGLSTSVAELIAGEPAELQPGDLLVIDSYGIPPVEGLVIHVPPEGPPQAAFDEILAAARRMLRSVPLTWIADPTVLAPTHVLSWQEGSWCLRPPPPASLRCLGAQPSRKALLAAVQDPSRARLFLRLPVPREQRDALAQKLQDAHGFVQLAADAATADYWLVGRLVEDEVQWALVMPDASGAEPRLLMPARSAFFAVQRGASGPSPLAQDERLLGELRRLARIKVWKHVEAPPAPGAFPYRLALRELATDRLVPPSEPLRAGREYQLVLVAEAVPARIPPRYVYVFNIDRDGNSTLLLPIAGHGNVENLVPDLRDTRDRAGPPPTLIPLGHGFTVTPPYGRDTIVMITSATALPNPDILAFSAGTRAGLATLPSSDALSRFLFGLNTNTRASRPIPTAWSVQRLLIESTDR